MTLHIQFSRLPLLWYKAKISSGVSCLENLSGSASIDATTDEWDCPHGRKVIEIRGKWEVLGVFYKMRILCGKFLKPVLCFRVFRGLDRLRYVLCFARLRTEVFRFLI